MADETEEPDLISDQSDSWDERRAFEIVGQSPYIEEIGIVAA